MTRSTKATIPPAERDGSWFSVSAARAKEVNRDKNDAHFILSIMEAQKILAPAIL
jgi:hypothetical protein